MRLAIMQPYFLPYIGYFQLMQAVDVFVIYDNIEFTKKGWINRNRFLLNGKPETFSIPVKKSNDYLHVVERTISPEFKPQKMFARFEGAYKKAPFWKEHEELIREVLGHAETNLFEYIAHSVQSFSEVLAIKPKVIRSSQVDIDHDLKGQDKVLAICKALEAKTYINTSGGVELYDRSAFAEQSIELQFIRSTPFEYEQFNHAFVPWLSVLDLLMFLPTETVCDHVQTQYEIF